MSKIDLQIHCVTNKEIPYLDKTKLILAGVGEENFPNHYLLSNNKQNIFEKEKFYSELTFHYWYWRNRLDLSNKNWVGFCQRRRLWIKSESEGNLIDKNNIASHLLENAEDSWKDYESIICKPISVYPVKKMKILKRGWKSLLRDPSILFDHKKQTVLLHFDMHHGYGNLEKAINLLNSNDKYDFYEYVKTKNKFNPHIMYISKSNILNNWFKSLFSWLENCESIFDKSNLINYDTSRLFAFLAERYSSYWFKKNTNFKEQPWIFIDPDK